MTGHNGAGRTAMARNLRPVLRPRRPNARQRRNGRRDPAVENGVGGIEPWRPPTRRLRHCCGARLIFFAIISLTERPSGKIDPGTSIQSSPSSEGAAPRIHCGFLINPEMYTR